MGLSVDLLSLRQILACRFNRKDHGFYMHPTSSRRMQEEVHRSSKATEMSCKPRRYGAQLRILEQGLEREACLVATGSYLYSCYASSDRTFSDQQDFDWTWTSRNFPRHDRRAQLPGSSAGIRDACTSAQEFLYWQGTQLREALSMSHGGGAGEETGRHDECS